MGSSKGWLGDHQIENPDQGDESWPAEEEPNPHQLVDLFRDRSVFFTRRIDQFSDLELNPDYRQPTQANEDIEPVGHQ